MFQNAYQGGTHVEIYDAKVNKDKEKSYAQLYRMTTPQGFSKIFDKDIKGYIYTIDGHSTKMRFPKDDRVDLCIVQNFLVFQIYLPFGSPWSLEIGIADTQKVNRRINLVSALNKIETKYFHVKAPNDIIKRGIWMNLSIDVNSFMEAWKGQTFRSIDSITIGSACKLRRVYSMKAPIFEISPDDDLEEQMYLQSSNYINQKPEEPPRNFSFPPGFQYTNQLITYQKILDNVDPKYLETSLGHGDSIESIKFGNASASQTKTAVGSKSHQPAGATSKTMKSTRVNNNHPPSFPKSELSQQQSHYSNITEDFQEKSMMGFNKARESSSNNTFQRNTQDRSPIPKQTTKHSTSVHRDSSVSNIRNFEEDRQESTTNANNPFRNTNNTSKARNSSKTLEKQSNSTALGSIAGGSVSAPKGIPKSPNSTFTRSPNTTAHQQQKDTLDRTGKGATTASSLRAGISASNPSSAAQQKSQQQSKSNPWQQNSTNASSSHRRKLFSDDQEPGRRVEEEIDENIEGEYYDNYDEFPPANAVPNKKSHNHVLQSTNALNQQHQQSASQQSIKKTTAPALTHQQTEQQKRNSKSANNFAGAKTQQIIGSSSTTTASSRNLPEKIKKKPEKKPVAAEVAEADQFAQSMNATDLNEESYYQLTQKFNTVSDPNQFRDLFPPSNIIANTNTNKQQATNNNQKQSLQQYKQQRQQSPQSDVNSREIEEDIEIDQYNSSPSVNRGRKSNIGGIPDKNATKRKQQSPEPVHIFEDSLERPQPVKQQQQQPKNPQSRPSLARGNNDSDEEDGGFNALGMRDHYHLESLSAQSKGVAPNYNIYENHLNKFITQSNRPFTPPFNTVVPLTGNSIITKKNNSTVVIQTQSRGPAGTTDFNEDPTHDHKHAYQEHASKNHRDSNHGQADQYSYDDGDDTASDLRKGSSSAVTSDQLEVIYDPVLNCYYDPASKQYYELKS